jgi:hypothetical protein
MTFGVMTRSQDCYFLWLLNEEGWSVVKPPDIFGCVWGATTFSKTTLEITTRSKLAKRHLAQGQSAYQNQTQQSGTHCNIQHYDTKHNNAQYNNTHYNNTQHNDTKGINTQYNYTQHNWIFAIFSICHTQHAIMFSVVILSVALFIVILLCGNADYRNGEWHYA